MLAPDPEMRSPDVGSARAKSHTSIITNEYADDIPEPQVIVCNACSPSDTRWLAMLPFSHGGAPR